VLMDALNGALKSIVGLLKLQKDAKKTDLEIDKLQRERAASESLIQRASSLKEIEKYDPKTRELMRAAREIERKSIGVYKLPGIYRLPEFILRLFR
jgi:hypothetical protein